MANFQATVSSQDASRYLQQLCKHWAHKFAVEFTPEKGRIDFGDGTIVDLVATGDALTVDLQSDHQERMQQVVEDHIVRFAFREELKFDWRPA